MLTGLYPHKLLPYNTWPYEKETAAHYFHRAGYMTGVIGKMHFLDGQTHGFDFKLDFNDWHQYLGPKTKLVAEEIYYPDSGCGLPQIPDLWKESGDPWLGTINRDDREGLAPVGRISSLREEDHFESFVSRELIRFLKTFGRRHPFFLVGSLLKPHAPFMPAERFGNMFHPNDMQLPASWGKVNLPSVPKYVQESIKYWRVTPEVRDPQQARRLLAMYYACLAQSDDNIGKVLRALTELGLEEDTIVVYTSDHGDMLGEHGLWQKFVLYEASVGVPLIIRAPGVTPRGAVCDSPVSQVQLLATLAELCGVSLPSGLDTTSLAKSLAEPATKLTAPVFAEHALGTGQARYMLRSGDYKYCHNVHDIPELYNLRSDPSEMNNLALLPNYRNRTEQLKEQLFTWWRPE